MMKSTGIVRRLDQLGRIVIPMELRRSLGINEQEPLEIFVRDDQIVIKKYEPTSGCALCGRVEGAMMLHEETQRIVCIACTVSPMTSIKN